MRSQNRFHGRENRLLFLSIPVVVKTDSTQGCYILNILAFVNMYLVTRSTARRLALHPRCSPEAESVRRCKKSNAHTPVPTTLQTRAHPVLQKANCTNPCASQIRRSYRLAVSGRSGVHHITTTTPVNKITRTVCRESYEHIAPWGRCSYFSRRSRQARAVCRTKTRTHCTRGSMLISYRCSKQGSNVCR